MKNNAREAFRPCKGLLRPSGIKQLSPFGGAESPRIENVELIGVFTLRMILYLTL